MIINFCKPEFLSTFKRKAIKIAKYWIVSIKLANPKNNLIYSKTAC